MLPTISDATFNQIAHILNVIAVFLLITSNVALWAGQIVLFRKRRLCSYRDGMMLLIDAYRPHLDPSRLFMRKTNNLKYRLFRVWAGKKKMTLNLEKKTFMFSPHNECNVCMKKLGWDIWLLVGVMREPPENNSYVVDMCAVCSENCRTMVELKYI